MLNIEGVIRILPATVSTEPGELRGENNSQPAVVQTLMTMSGPVQVIFPTSSVDNVVEGLQKAKKEADENITSSADLYIPQSAMEVEQVKAAVDAVNQGKEV